jgi:hypothetical protein
LLIDWPGGHAHAGGIAFAAFVITEVIIEILETALENFSDTREELVV